MDSEVKAGENATLSPNPVYYEVSPRIVIVLRLFGGIAAFLMFLAVIFCFVEGANDEVMYLLAVNLIVSSIIGGIVAWWYHKGIIEANKITFMAFLGLCIIFQAITSDIYVFHRVPVQHSTPTVPPTIHNSSSTTPKPTTASI